MKTYGVIARPPVSAPPMLDIAVVSGPMPRQTTSAHRRYRREEDTETYPVNVGDNHEWCWHELWTQLTLFELKSDESGLRSPTETASMITVIGGTKGGTGKSTIATNFAVMHAIAGADILLVDADEQGTSTAFTNMRNQSRPEAAQPIPASHSPVAQYRRRCVGLHRSTRKSSLILAGATSRASAGPWQSAIGMSCHSLRGLSTFGRSTGLRS
jgi:hypothetical protein